MKKTLLIICFVLFSTFSFSYYVSSEENTDENQTPIEQTDPTPAPEPTPEDPTTIAPEPTPVEPTPIAPKPVEPTPKPEDPTPITPAPKPAPKPVVPTPIVPSTPTIPEDVVTQPDDSESEPIEEEVEEELDEIDHDIIDLIVLKFENDEENQVRSFDNYILRNILSIFLYNEPDEISLARFSEDPFSDIAKKLTNEQVEELQWLIKDELFEIHEDYQLLAARLDEFMLVRAEILSLVETPIVMDEVKVMKEDNLAEKEEAEKSRFSFGISQFFKWLGSIFS